MPDDDKKPLTGAEAQARLIELTEGIRRAREMDIVEMIPDLEKEREELKRRFIRCVS